MVKLFQIPETLLPPDTYAFIAGGYAACPERALDMDVWVLDTTGNPEKTRAALLLWLSDYHWVFGKETHEEKFRADGPGYDEMDCRILKVAVIPYYTTTIHLMVTDAPPLALLRNFDVSTHQIALIPSSRLPEGDLLRGPGWTSLDQEPVQLKETSATFARMEKIRTRYADLRTHGKN